MTPDVEEPGAAAAEDGGDEVDEASGAAGWRFRTIASELGGLYPASLSYEACLPRLRWTGCQPVRL